MPIRTLTAGAGFILVLGLGAAPPSAQVPAPPPGTRLVVDAGLPALDRGFRREALALDVALPAAMVPGPALPYIPGRVIVKFRPGAGASAVASATRDAGAKALAPLPYANFQILDVGPDQDPEQVARDLSGQPDVEYAQADYLAHFYTVPNDPLYREQWNFPALDMERVWDINPGATRDVVVAVLDSGIAFENTVIRYNTVPIGPLRFPDGTIGTINYGLLDVPYAAAPDLVGADRIVAPRDFTWNDPHPVDTLGHGTHVAGTIGQLTNNSTGGAGMAYNVRLMPVKVAAGGNWDIVFGAPSPNFSDDQIARAIRYAADNGAKAMNMSFGRDGPPAPVVEDAVRYAVSKGAFCVFAAGNAGTSATVSRYAEIGPKVEGAVAVAALGPTLNRARYSSVGAWVELSAPGGDTFEVGSTGGILQQTLDQSFFASPFVRPRFDVVIYASFQGTSMAAPHVTGFAALLYQQGLTSPAAIEAAMKKYATDKGPPGRDNEYGIGMINPRATLRGLGLGR